MYALWTTKNLIIVAFTYDENNYIPKVEKVQEL